MHSINTITAKIYFQIIENEDHTVLGEGDTEKAWLNISAEAEKLSNNKQKDKALGLIQNIQKLSCKYQIVKNCVWRLKRQKNAKIEQILRNQGFRLNEETFNQDLLRIKRELENVNVKIKRYAKTLEDMQPEGESSTYEDVYFSYASITHPYKTADTILLTEFFSWEKQVINKLQALQNGSK